MAFVYDNIDAAPEQIWNRLDTISVLETRAWLGLPRWPDDGVGYLVSGDTMLPFRMMTDPHGWTAMNLVDICAGEALELGMDETAVAAVRAVAVPHLVVAAPGYHTVPIGRRDSGALCRIVDAVEEEATARKVPWGFAHLPPEGDYLLRILRDRGYETAVVSASAWLDLPGWGFSDYLASFQNHRRNEIRREIRQFSALNCTVSKARGESVADWLPITAELEAILQRSHGFSAEPTYFLETQQAYLRRFGDRMHVIRADLAGQTVATVTLFSSGSDIVVRSLGLREGADIRKAAVYFNITYYAVIDLAYQLGIRRISFGPRALRTKALRGARLVPLHAALPPEAPEPLSALLKRAGPRVLLALAAFRHSKIENGMAG